MLWVTFVLGAAILFFSYNFRKKVFVLGLFVLFSVFGVSSLMIFNPDTANIALLRFKTITHGREFHTFDVAVDENLISRIDPARYGELLNVGNAVARRWAYLWGSGYGAYYDDKVVPFPSYLTSGFAAHSLESGLYYRIHFFTVHIFFKYGLVGLALVALLWILPGIRLFGYFRRRGQKLRKGESLFLNCIRALVAFFPTLVFQFYWSGKGLFVSGLLLAVSMELSRNIAETAQLGWRGVSKIGYRKSAKLALRVNHV